MKKKIMYDLKSAISIVSALSIISSFSGCDKNWSTVKKTSTAPNESVSTNVTEYTGNQYCIKDLSVFQVYNKITNETNKVIGFIKKENFLHVFYMLFYRLLDIHTLGLLTVERLYVDPNDYVAYYSYNGDLLMQEKIGEDAEIKSTEYDVIIIDSLENYLNSNNITFSGRNSDGTNIQFCEEDLKELEKIINGYALIRKNQLWK